MNYWSLLVLAGGLHGCAALDKDNEPTPPLAVEDTLKTQLHDVYVPALRLTLDENGLVVQGDSIGDSALFSCLARVAGAADFDPAILFRDGKPIRHPSMHPNPNGSRAPISKDMVNGHLWCLYDLYRKGDTDHGLELVSAMISFGKSHPLTLQQELGWLFCTEEDRVTYKISETDWFGQCFMPPAVIKDIYRVAKALGMPCDEDCQFYSTIGFNIPADKTGFERHLAVLTTIRNGLLDGGINDNSLSKVLDTARVKEPRNAFYQAAFHLFTDGDQSAAFSDLKDQTLFPSDKLPTKANYCTEWLFQRDDDSLSHEVSPDWLPCPLGGRPDRGRGFEWAFAAALALGEIH